MIDEEKQRLIVMIATYLLVFLFGMLAKSQVDALRKSMIEEARITPDKKIEYKDSTYENCLLRDLG